MNVEPQVCHMGLIFLWGMSGATGRRWFGCPIRTEGGLVGLPPQGLHTRLTDSKQQLPQIPLAAGEKLLRGFPSSFWLDAINTESGRSCRSLQVAGTNSRGWGKYSLLRKQNQGVLGNTGVFYTQFGIPVILRVPKPTSATIPRKACN